MSQAVAAARPAHALDEAALAQPREELLEIGERNLLSLGDLGERDGLAAAVLGEVDHRHHRVASLGAQPHAAPFAASPRARGNRFIPRALTPLARRFFDTVRLTMLSSRPFSAARRHRQAIVSRQAKLAVSNAI